MNDIEIDIANIGKSFRDVRALDGVSMHFVPGILYGVIGPAGAGKTTLFRVMLNLMRPGAGAVTYTRGGRAVPFESVREHIAYMPQSQSLYADLSVDEHLDFFRRLYGIGDAAYGKKKEELVHLARLGKFLNLPAGKLSGGMYKKLGLICALLRSPKIMLLDEPTNGVDPISRREFWALLNQARAGGIMVIMSTAYMDEAERCGAVVLMEQGRVLDTGEPRDLLRRTGAATFDEFFVARGGGVS